MIRAYTRPCCVVAFSHCARTGAARSKRGFHSGLSALAGLYGAYLNSSESKGSIRIDLRPKMKKIDLDGGLLWLGVCRGVRVLGSGDFARFVACLPL